jgi:hypothetical protein
MDKSAARTVMAPLRGCVAWSSIRKLLLYFMEVLLNVK